MEEYPARITACGMSSWHPSGDGLAGTVEAKTRCHVTPVSSTTNRAGVRDSPSLSSLTSLSGSASSHTARPVGRTVERGVQERNATDSQPLGSWGSAGSRLQGSQRGGEAAHLLKRDGREASPPFCPSTRICPLLIRCLEGQTSGARISLRVSIGLSSGCRLRWACDLDRRPQAERNRPLSFFVFHGQTACHGPRPKRVVLVPCTGRPRLAASGSQGRASIHPYILAPEFAPLGLSAGLPSASFGPRAGCGEH